MSMTDAFAAERPRLVALATRMLGDPMEAEDIAQQAWLRLHGAVDAASESATAEVMDEQAAAPPSAIVNLPAWLTTVTVRLCLDRLKAKTPSPLAAQDLSLESSAFGPDHGESGARDVRPHTAYGIAADPADHVALADTVAGALHVVLDRLTPTERVAFILHDSFGFEFPMIAELLDTTPTNARKLASRARAKVAAPAPEDRLADWEVVDAFLTAARGGDFERLIQLLAPDAVIAGDAAARALGTPELIAGQREVATFFNGAAASALAVFVGERPGAAWFDRGTPRVAFDFTISDGRVERIDFRAEPELVATLRRRRGADTHPSVTHPTPSPEKDNS